jgi:rhodanese-related sulfurtransferase
VWLEGLLVLVSGGLVALAANCLSPRGLSLTRDYFPAADMAHSPMPVAADRAAALLKGQGLNVTDHDQAIRLFRDPRRDQETIVFIDARQAGRYEAGHVPGAYPFDPFHPESHLPDLLPVCLTAETIVIYCTGGECEDSVLAARTLREAGVAADKLVVYPGGLAEWEAKGQPLETGPRNSGQLRPKP